MARKGDTKARVVQCKLTISNGSGLSATFDINENLLNAAVEQHGTRIHHRKRALEGMVKDILFKQLHTLYTTCSGLGDQHTPPVCNPNHTSNLPTEREPNGQK